MQQQKEEIVTENTVARMWKNKIIIYEGKAALSERQYHLTGHEHFRNERNFYREVCNLAKEMYASVL